MLAMLIAFGYTLCCMFAWRDGVPEVVNVVQFGAWIYLALAFQYSRLSTEMRVFLKNEVHWIPRVFVLVNSLFQLGFMVAAGMHLIGLVRAASLAIWFIAEEVAIAEERSET